MVVVRLARGGCKKRPFYHVVVTDSEAPRDGRFLERLGFFDPRATEGGTRLDLERLAYWRSKGAQLSERVAKVARSYAKLQTAESGAAA